MFFLLPIALGDLSKEFGNCFRFIFSLWCHRFHLPFPVFRALTPLQERLTINDERRANLQSTDERRVLFYQLISHDKT